MLKSAEEPFALAKFAQLLTPDKRDHFAFWSLRVHAEVVRRFIAEQLNRHKLGWPLRARPGMKR